MGKDTAAPDAGKSQRQEVKWNNADAPPIPGVVHGVLRSPSMGRDIGYNVWLPPRYNENDTRYPVVYFLHGAGGNENSDAGGFSSMVQREITAGKIPPVICVFPNGGLSGYRDNPETKVMGETMIVKELIPLIDKQYRTIAAAKGRAVCGFSMGGGGAIRLALKYPELFSAAASWAAAMGGRRGNGDQTALARENAERIRGNVRLLLIVGDKDFTFAPHPAFTQTLIDLKLPHTYRVLEGVEHNLGAYHLKTGAQLVQFIAGGFGATKKETE